MEPKKDSLKDAFELLMKKTNKRKKKEVNQPW
jgi:hypothetical protein